MAFEDMIRALAVKAKNQGPLLATEEATKTALVMPFINALGYDVFNPSEVIPEYIADVGVKKGEKVDYAIKRDDEFILLIECKPVSSTLNSDHMSQLFRYFSVTKARFALLTNGVTYQFYTDLEEANKLDQRPFLVFDLLELKPSLLNEVKKFSKEIFNVETILSTANTLKYVAALKAAINMEFETPSETLVRFFASKIYDGRITSQVKDEFSALLRLAFREVIVDSVTQRLSSALAQTETIASKEAPQLPELQAEEIVTTDEEKDGFLIVRAIARQVLPVERIFIRDQKSYCAILVDDNNRRPLMRLHLGKATKTISLFDGDTEERVKIDSVDQIYSYSERILKTAAKYAALQK